MKTPITYYGGKQSLLPVILPLFPPHEIYTETFGGGLAAFFAKRPVRSEVVNDTNGELINFYMILKTKFHELSLYIDTTLHSRSLHHDAWIIYTNPHLFSDVQRAWAVWVLSKQGFSGQLSSSFGYDVQGHSAATKIQNAKEALTIEYQKRLENVTIECRDGLEIIRAWDRENTFHYVDTPYFNSNCGHYDGYSQRDFENCLDVLEKVRGKFLLSNYPSHILKDRVEKNGWFYLEKEMNVSVSGKFSKTKVERLAANYDITDGIYNQK